MTNDCNACRENLTWLLNTELWSCTPPKTWHPNSNYILIPYIYSHFAGSPPLLWI